MREREPGRGLWAGKEMAQPRHPPVAGGHRYRWLLICNSAFSASFGVQALLAWQRGEMVNFGLQAPAAIGMAVSGSWTAIQILRGRHR